MKLNKLIKAAAALLVAATALAGCKFEGTKSDFKGDARNGYVSQNDAAPANAATISVTSGNITNAFEKTFVTVEISAKDFIDEKSIDKAIDFYKLSSAANAGLVKVRGDKLTKSIKKINTNNSVTPKKTTVIFEVDPANGKEAQIALVADAKVLKDKAGYLVLNGNGNEKCGEESDSIIRYITVNNYKDGDTVKSTETVVGTNEIFAPTFSFGALNYSEEFKDGKPTGAIKATITPLATTVGEDSIYPDSFAAEINKMYSLRTLAIGEKKWTETAVTNWSWNDTDKRYEAVTTTTLAYGTKYEFLVKSNNSVKWEAAAPRYGHTPVISYKKDKKQYTENGDLYNYLTAAPDWIAVEPDNSDSATEGTFGDYNYISIYTYQSTQDDILDYEWQTNAVRVYIKTALVGANDLRFGEIKDFVIADSRYNKIKTKAPVVYQEDDKGAYSVMIELEDKNLDTSNLKVLVGEGTTIKGNKVYTNQVKFGAPKIEGNKIIPGYVELTNN